MSDPYVIGAVVVGVVNGLAATLGFAQWALGRPGPPFWLLARTGQGVAAIYAVVCGIYALAADPPPDSLAWVYILTPVAVSYFAEQLRLIAATTVLDRHGYESADELRVAAAVNDAAQELGIDGSDLGDEPGGGSSGRDARHGEGDTDDDASTGARLVTGIVHEVVLREVVVLSTGALVITFLAWRAWLTG